MLNLFQANTAILVATLDVGFPTAVILIMLFTMKGDLRLDILGFVCAVLNTLMYASPFAIMVSMNETHGIQVFRKKKNHNSSIYINQALYLLELRYIFEAGKLDILVID